ncbi:C-type lectin domain family 12 member B-like isoform X1 [Bos indicus]|uniref:C-type lectin domain family 12 member B-like isoform X1 n=2 Tax=Bos indicus TaxID=9915 RepID=A0ABM4SEM4_BOSIN
MSEEVTYATLKFSNPKTKKPQESHSLKRTDSHETPDLELGGEAETGAGSIRGTAEVTESRAMKGHSAPSKVWYPIAFVSLSLNLVVLAGLGALGLMHYYKLIFNSKTVYDVQLNVTDHMETTTLPTDMPTTVSVASVVSDSVRPHRRQPTSLPSPWVSPDCPYSDPALHLCSEIWIQYGSNFYNFSTKIICNTCDSDCEKNHSSLMNMDDGENRNRTKLFLRCRPLYIFQTLLNSVSNNTNQTERNVSDISILTCLVPP